MNLADEKFRVESASHSRSAVPNTKILALRKQKTCYSSRTAWGSSFAFSRLNAINVLEDEGFVNAEEFNYRTNQRRVRMAQM